MILPFTSMKYRIRIFDNYNHLKTVEVKITGQRFVKIAVDSPLLGETVYMAFMISPKVRPFIFGGQELEYNFDIREATPMTALSSVCPDLIKEINEDLSTLVPDEEPKTQDAEFTLFEDEKQAEKPDEEPKPDAVPEEPAKETSFIEEKIQTAKENLQPLIKGAKKIANVTKDASTLIKVLAHLNLGETRTKQVKKIFALCANYPSLLYWLPTYLELDQEVKSICSAVPIFHVGVLASYHAAQSSAQISEKVLQKPKEKMEWATVVLVVAIGIFGLLFLVVFGKIIHAF